MFRRKERKSGVITVSVIGGMVGGMAAMYLLPQLEKQIGRMNQDTDERLEAPLSNMMTEMGKEILPALQDGSKVGNDTFQNMVNTFIEQEQ